MGASKKRNKKHRPRAVLKLGGLAIVADKHRAARAKHPLSSDNQLNVCISYQQSIEALTAGHAEEYHLDTIIYALNIGTILAQKTPELGIDHLDLLTNASAGIQRAKVRYLAGRGLGLDGDALASVREAYALHEEQMRVATAGELEAAIDEMHERVAEAANEELMAA